MDDRRIGTVSQYREFVGEEEHVAESKWQYCKCKSCKEKRHRLENLPGPPIDWDKIRNKDERY